MRVNVDANLAGLGIESTLRFQRGILLELHSQLLRNPVNRGDGTGTVNGRGKVFAGTVQLAVTPFTIHRTAEKLRKSMFAEIIKKNVEPFLDSIVSILRFPGIVRPVGHIRERDNSGHYFDPEDCSLQIVAEVLITTSLGHHFKPILDTIICVRISVLVYLVRKVLVVLYLPVDVIELLD